ncbi:response regulator [Flaviramulus sp. BrNp1-15]|uniref:response regulator n=1 Tax=Flaviramulus sp. BrNp1-15 TaxID=2916754 RepID=UPI001EE8E53C|nr:response regulator [Flaviramulus sp. BrNp1-15]ULC58056.1 response regulator [Flaviramulus sp. BrNp1-15]
MEVKIMLIDDNKIDLFVHQRIIEKLEIDSKVMPFTSGISAIKYLNIVNDGIHNQSTFIPDIIFLDINMPEMNGFEFLKEYKNLRIIKDKPINIYMLSSSTNFQDIKRVESEKICNGFINKPLTKEGLNKIITTHKHPYLSQYDFLENDVDVESSF